MSDCTARVTLCCWWNLGNEQILSSQPILRRVLKMLLWVTAIWCFADEKHLGCNLRSSLTLLVQIFYLIQPILASFPSAQYMCELEKPVRAFVGAQAERTRSERCFCRRGALPGRIEVQMSPVLHNATCVPLQLKHTSACYMFHSQSCTSRCAFLLLVLLVRWGCAVCVNAQCWGSQVVWTPL